MIREFPNGETLQDKLLQSAYMRKRTRGSETSQYPEEDKIIMIPLVAASERGRA